MSAYVLRIPFTRHVLVERGQPQRGDVVVFDSPTDGTRLIKRVVAVAGDRVELRDGRLLIDGVPMADPALPVAERFGARVAQLDLADGGGPDIGGVVVPPGRVLVLGDHRGRSADGRWFGFVEADAIYARALAVYWRSGEGPQWRKL
jgi:signal peptidase I